MGEFAAVVKRFMKLREMSLRATARAAGYSDQTVLSKVLNGHRPVTPYIAACLDQALDAGGLIVAAAERETAQDAGVARLPLRALADQAAGLGAWAETGTAGPATIAALDEEIGRIIREHSFAAPGPLILRAADACGRAFGMLKQHQRLRHARELHVVAAKCCSFLSVALGDTGRQAEAAGYARTAFTLAEESGDDRAMALAFSVLARVAFWDGLNGQSADYASRGYYLAGNTGTLRVLLACQVADASPVPRAREAVAQAARALDECSAHEPGVFSCGHARAAGYAATVRLREGDFRGVLAAAAASDEALRGGEKASFGSVTQTRITASLACLVTGDASQAAGLLNGALSLPREMRLATFAAKMGKAGALASAPAYKGSSDARALAEGISGYLGREPDPMPYPLALGTGGTR